MPLDYKHGAPDGAWPRRRLDYRLRLMHKSHSFSRRISGGQQPVLTHQSINPSIRLQFGSGYAGLRNQWLRIRAVELRCGFAAQGTGRAYSGYPGIRA